MSDGRTVWLPKDAAWWRREYVVELGEEFGAEGPAVLDWLCCEAKAQNDGGTVKAGYRSVGRGCFVDVVTVGHVVSRAVQLGALDDFEGDDRRFTCRISGWASDQAKGLAADRKARQRERKAPPMSRPVPSGPQMSPRGEERREEEEEERGGEHGQPTATAAVTAPPGLHPDHGEVVGILEAARTKRPGVVVDEASVNSALMAHRSADAVSAAHEVVSQLSDGTARTDIASTVLRWVLRGQGEQRGGGGQRRGGPRRGETPDVVSGRGSSSALARAMQRDREQADVRRRRAEQADRGAA